MTDDASKKKRLRQLGIGCLALAVVSCCVCVGGGGGYMQVRRSAIHGTIEEFLTATGAHDYEAAYALMAPEYRQQYDLARFRREVNECRPLETYGSYDIESTLGERRLEVTFSPGSWRGELWVRDYDGDERLRSVAVYIDSRQTCRIAPRAGTPF